MGNLEGRSQTSVVAAYSNEATKGIYYAENMAAELSDCPLVQPLSGDLVTLQHQVVHQVRADEACPASHQNA